MSHCNFYYYWFQLFHFYGFQLGQLGKRGLNVVEYIKQPVLASINGGQMISKAPLVCLDIAKC